MANLTGGRFFLKDEGQCWRIAEGSVDLFLVDVYADGRTGPLFYVATFDAGSVLYAPGSAAHAQGSTAILCQPRVGANVSEVEPSSIGASERQRWIGRLAEAAGLPKDLAETSLDAAHSLFLSAMIRRHEEVEQSEKSRLQDKDKETNAAVRGALQRLGSVLSTHHDPEAVVADESSAILAVCRLLGIHAGFEMLAPKGFRASENPTEDAALIARTSNVRYRAIVLQGEWWKKDNGPLLAFHAGAEGRPPSPVALLHDRGRYRIYDPAHGSITPLTREDAARVLPDAVMFYRPFPARPLSWKDILRFGLFGTRRDAMTVILVGIVAGMLALVTPIATGILFDTIIPGAQKAQLFQMAALLFTTSLVGFLISLTSNVAMMRMEGRMEAAVQSAVWDRLLSLPVPFFRDYTSGDLVTRSLAIGQIRKMLTSTVMSSVMSGIFSVFSFVLLFYYSSSMAWLAGLYVIVVALFTLVCGYLQMRYQRKIYESIGKISGLTLEIMNGISKLRTSGAESHAFKRWASEYAEQKTTYLKSSRIATASAVFGAVFPSLAAIAIYYYGFMQMMMGSLTPGGFIAFNAAFGQFIGAALGLATTLISTIAIIPAYERASPILKAIPESSESRIDPGTLRGEIEVNRLVFRYKPELPIVLRDVSFHIKAGEFVAFVGYSGSGKSTLLRLLLGFERPESGFIHFDGLDMEDIDPQALRRQLGVVLQNGKVFDGDLFTNIVGSAPLSQEQAWEAARAAGLDKDIEAMPMGMHTRLGEGGVGLSGGQRQRLLIARAIVNHPRILLFDEATSALDNQTQAIVSESLEKLHATRIVIAHRLSTILNADRIFVFSDGQIVQQGTYQELIAQDGLFRYLAQRQIA